MQRSLLLFKNSIHSEETYRVYKYELDRFITYFKLRDYNSLASMDIKMLQTMIEDYVMEKKSKNLARSTIKTPLSALELFCDTNDLMLNWKKTRRLLPPQKKKSGRKAYTTEQVRKILEFTPDLRNKAIIHFVAASGVRIGALPELQIRSVDEMPGDCKSIIIYEGEKEEYVTFLTPEASKVLDEYLARRQKDGEFLKPESPLFRAKYAIGIAKANPLKKVSFQGLIDRALRRAGLRFGRDGSRRDIQLDHGFRKRWNTIMKSTNGMKLIHAEKMFSHSTPSIPLDETYTDFSNEALFEEYQKAILFLTISDEDRLRFENQQKQQEIEGIEKKNHELRDLTQRIEELETGPKTRWSVYFKDMFKFHDDSKAKVLLSIFQFWFEMRATEEEKREIWKKLQQAKKQGKTLDMSEFGDSKGLSMANLISSLNYDEPKQD